MLLKNSTAFVTFMFFSNLQCGRVCPVTGDVWCDRKYGSNPATSAVTPRTPCHRGHPVTREAGQEQDHQEWVAFSSNMESDSDLGL